MGASRLSHLGLRPGGVCTCGLSGQEVLQYHAVDMLEPNQTYQVKVFLLDKENRPIQACTERVLFGKIGA